MTENQVQWGFLHVLWLCSTSWWPPGRAIFIAFCNIHQQFGHTYSSSTSVRYADDLTITELLMDFAWSDLDRFGWGQVFLLAINDIKTMGMIISARNTINMPPPPPKSFQNIISRYCQTTWSSDFF